MKKILIVKNHLDIGGIQRSLVNLLSEIHDQYEITLLLFADDRNCKKNLEKEIPKNIKIVRVKSDYKTLGYSQREAKNLFEKLWRGAHVIATRLFGFQFVTKMMALTQRRLSGYDAVISFMQSSRDQIFYAGCNEFVQYCTNSDKKITFLHGDFILDNSATEKVKTLYRKFDLVAACSEGCKNRFLEAMPDMKNKVVVVENCNKFDEIVSLSKENPYKYDESYINVITVARLGREKGIDRAINAISYCIKKNIKVKYHIVGEGIAKNELINLTNSLGIQDNVIFHGMKRNPYRYIVGADLFLLPSYHEAAPMVFSEAICLGVPILATKTLSTDQMILEKKAGWVCENSEDGIKNMLFSILSNKKEMDRIKECVKKIHMDNHVPVEQFAELIEGRQING